MDAQVVDFRLHALGLLFRDVLVDLGQEELLLGADRVAVDLLDRRAPSNHDVGECRKSY